MSNTLNKSTNKVLVNKLQNTLNNKLINESDLSVKTTELSNELLETTKIIKNCTSYKDKKKIDRIDLDEIEKYLAELKKEEQKKEEWVIINYLMMNYLKQILD